MINYINRNSLSKLPKLSPHSPHITENYKIHLKTNNAKNRTNTNRRRMLLRGRMIFKFGPTIAIDTITIINSTLRRIGAILLKVFMTRLKRFLKQSVGKNYIQHDYIRRETPRYNFYYSECADETQTQNNKNVSSSFENTTNKRLTCEFKRRFVDSDEEGWKSDQCTTDPELPLSFRLFSLSMVSPTHTYVHINRIK